MTSKRLILQPSDRRKTEDRRKRPRSLVWTKLAVELADLVLAANERECGIRPATVAKFGPLIPPRREDWREIVAKAREIKETLCKAGQ